MCIFSPIITAELMIIFGDYGLRAASPHPPPPAPRGLRLPSWGGGACERHDWPLTQGARINCKCVADDVYDDGSVGAFCNWGPFNSKEQIEFALWHEQTM
jgi:hypothetical protein